MVTRKWLILDDCGVKCIPNCTSWTNVEFWTNVEPCTHESLGTQGLRAPPYSCSPINPTFLSKKRIHTLWLKAIHNDYLTFSLGQISGHSLPGSCFWIPHRLYRSGLGAAIISKHELGKDELPSSHGCWHS